MNAELEPEKKHGLTGKPIKFRRSAFTTIVVFIVLVIIGIALFPKISIQLESKKFKPNLTISFSYRDRPPHIVEQDVTSRLEGLLNTIRGVSKVKSTSNIGRGSINLEFDKREDIDAIRFEVASLIREVYPKLPNDVSHPMIQYNKDSNVGDNETVLIYNLNSTAPPPVIQKYAEDNIHPAFSNIEGLDELRISGAEKMEYELTYDQNQLSTFKITFRDIRSALSSAFDENVIGLGKEIDILNGNKEEKSIILRTALKEQINNFDIPIKNVNGRIIRLFDICKIRYIEKMPSSYFRINGENNIYLRFTSQKGANTIVLAEKIKEKITEIESDLPADYKISKRVDNSEELKKDLNRIAYRTLFSVIILLLFVFIISRNTRYLIIILISLVANLSIAVIFYYLLKVEIHLFSLAGITVSLGIIIDNTIVMIDHLRFKKNKKIFIAVFAATLTTIGALSVIFFLDEQTRLNLLDFSIVVIVNLAVSLFIALFLIPALLEKIPLKKLDVKRYFKRRRKIIRFSNVYGKFINFSVRWRKLYIIAGILLFGIPVFWLPGEIKPKNEDDSLNKFETFYNKTLGSEWYGEKLKKTVDKGLGGTLRLFNERVSQWGGFFGRNNLPRLTISAGVNMHEGATIEQLNHVVIKMEKLLQNYEQLDYFDTRINMIGGRPKASMNIKFKPEFEGGGFPFHLYDEMTSFGIGLGGPDWSIVLNGVPNMRFQNSVRGQIGNQKITLLGYNYEELMSHAERLVDRLKIHSRVGNTIILGASSRYYSYDADYSFQYNLKIDKEYLINKNLTASDIRYSLENLSVNNYSTKLITSNGKKEFARFKSIQSDNFDKWQMYHVPVNVRNTLLKLDEKGILDKDPVSKAINKENQQYILTVTYDYNGNYRSAAKLKKENIKETKELLPLGFFIKDYNNYGGWNRPEKQYYLIFLVIGIIFFICAILLESLSQPMAVITMIPLSFVGVFLTFSLFEINFDTGGFASFLLLSGITVNSALFIINDYNNVRRRVNYNRTKLVTYLKAYNGKIVPVFLTIISTVLGLIPFLFGEEKERFWYSLATGTIGGLIFSIIAIIIFLPAFMNVKKLLPGEKIKKIKRKERKKEKVLI